MTSEQVANKDQVYATVIFGNLYCIEKKRIMLGKAGKLIKNVSIVDTPIPSDSREETKGAAADYNVAGIEHEDVAMTAVTA